MTAKLPQTCGVPGCDAEAVLGITWDTHSFRESMEIEWRCYDHAPEVR